MTSNHDLGPDRTPEPEPSVREPSGFLTPAVSAITAFTLAVTALMGQNIITVGVSTVLGPGFGRTGPSVSYVAWGVGTVLQVGLVVLFAWRATRLHTWEGTLARAAVVVAAVAVVASVLVFVGGLLDTGRGF